MSNQESGRKIVKDFYKVLEDYKKRKMDMPFTNEENEIINKFLSHTNEDGTDLLTIYLKVLEILEQYSDNQKMKLKTAQNFKGEMDEILESLSNSHFMDSRFVDYLDEINDLIERLNKKIFSYCNRCDLDNMSPEGIANIQKLLRMAVDSVRHSVDSIDDFKSFEEKANSKGITINKRTKEIYCKSCIETMIYQKFAKERGLEKGVAESEVINLHTAEEYFLDYLIAKVPSMDLEEAWNDDIVVLMMQLKNNNMLQGTDAIESKVTQLDEIVKSFIKEHIKPEEVESARETINTIINGNDVVEGYRRKKLDNPQIIQEFIGAYKLVYMYEFLSGEQLESKDNSTDVPTFISRQIKSIVGQTNTDEASKLLMRSTQDLVVKTAQKQKKNIPDYLGNFPENPIVVEFYTNKKQKQGDSAPGIVTIDLKWFLKKDKEIEGEYEEDGFVPYDTVDSVVHEVDHNIGSLERKTGYFRNFLGYKVMLSEIMCFNFPVISSTNYVELPSEQRAFIIGILAQIQAYREFPAGDIDLLNKINIAKKNMANVLVESVDNKLVMQNPRTEEFEKVPYTFIKDLAMKEMAAKGDDTLIKQILQFEYHEDGTPKTLEEILADQYKEIELIKDNYMNPPIGPADIVARIKMRLQIMMERAMLLGEEEKCFSMIREFLAKNKDVTKTDKFFDLEIPEDLFNLRDWSVNEAEKCFKTESELGIENACFLLQLNELSDRIIRRQFKESMFSCIAKAIGGSGKVVEGKNYTMVAIGLDDLFGPGGIIGVPVGELIPDNPVGELIQDNPDVDLSPDAQKETDELGALYEELVKLFGDDPDSDEPDDQEPQ